MGAAARAACTSRATVVRTFSVSAGRAKELAGNIGALPNMRHAQRSPVGPLKVRKVETYGGQSARQMLTCLK